jgi:cyclopropane-fatty-acyl-phospholipid synthase
MFEAVGEKYWDAYFQKIASALKKGGSAFVQTITIADDRFANYRKNGDFIRQFIFPGGMLPSPSVFAARAQKAGLQIIEKFEFAQSYAKTLDVWLKNFNDKHAQIQNLGYDEKFMRLWKFYLSACIAGFQTGRTNVMQVELRHA